MFLVITKNENQRFSLDELHIKINYQTKGSRNPRIIVSTSVIFTLAAWNAA
jgi:hypothetical protein